LGVRASTARTRRISRSTASSLATRQAAEYHLYRGEHERAGQAARDASRIKELRRAMADAHPDRGGTAEQFIERATGTRRRSGPRDGNVRPG
jgi:hypothetical protein